MSASMTVKEAQSTGVLYIVPTPIGNLADISERAIETLQQVDVIAAEDTRHSRPLMQHLGVKTKMFALHEHNESQQLQAIVEQLEQGQSLALISDAGTPLISDPGYLIVRECRQRGIKVVALPGACAITTALSGAGLATDRFTFEGFLPAKPQQRKKQLRALSQEPRTLVFYESPHRILHTLADIDSDFDRERPLVLARELTKQFETYLHGTASELLARLHSDPNQQRGEMVLMVSGYKPEANHDDEIPMPVQTALKLLSEELPLKRAAAICATLFDARKNSLYQWGLKNLNK